MKLYFETLCSHSIYNTLVNIPLHFFIGLSHYGDREEYIHAMKILQPHFYISIFASKPTAELSVKLRIITTFLFLFHCVAPDTSTLAPVEKSNVTSGKFEFSYSYHILYLDDKIILFL